MPSASSLSEAEIQDLIALVETKVRKFVQNSPCRDCDLQDRIQEVFVRVLARLPAYDPNRATLSTFLARTAENALVDDHRRRTADKRNPLREVGSLDDERRGQNGWSDPKAQERFRSESTLRDLKLDLADALAALPPKLRRLAEGLEEWTPTEVAEREGIHPGTVYRRLASIRRRWEDGTLRDYLDS